MLVSHLLSRSTWPAVDDLPYLELAADIAEDTGMERWPDTFDRLAPEVLSKLRIHLERVRDDHARFAIQILARAASAIGRLGDRRVGCSVRRRSGAAKPLESPDFDWRGPNHKVPGEPYPGGDFQMDGDPKANGSNKTPFKCDRIKYPYLVARIPVTVAQDRLFVLSDGYKDDALWTPDGLELRNGGATEKVPDWVRGSYQDESFPIRGPRDYDAVFQTPDHPRVGSLGMKRSPTFVG